MKKKITGFLLCIIVTFMIYPITARADIGPKPSVHITFENMGDEVCYGTLLSKDESTGPSTAWETSHIRNYHLDDDIWEAFENYEDADGYYFLQEGWVCSVTKQLNWTYYPPNSFKILLYYPETDTYIVSDIYEKYAFDSYYTVDMDGFEIHSVEEQSELLVADKSYNYTWELISLFCRIIITILLEMGIAFLFGFREQKILVTIFGVNAITQVGLNILLNIINYNSGSLAFMISYFLFEIIVFAVEALFYSVILKRVSSKEVSAWKPVLYAFIANAISYAGGFIIARWIPGIF